MPTTTKTRRSPTRRPPTEAERAERREADRRRMAEAISALQSSEGWGRWLRVRRHFHDYSLHNQLLIAHQCPQATRVAGFRSWLEIGYAVRKGSRAIRIWAPMPPSKKALKRWREEGADPNERPKTHFRMVAVFDRSQVDEVPDFPGGAVELEPPHEPLQGTSLARLLDPLRAFVEELGPEVSFEEIPGAAAGYHEPATGRIVIDNGIEHSPNAQVSTLIHEISHALVRLEHQHDDPKLSYAEEEVVVEAVAYSVCSSVGFDTSVESVPYVAGWGGAEAQAPIEHYAALIDRLAGRIEAAIAAVEAR